MFLYRIAILFFASIFTISCQTLPKGVTPIMATWMYGHHTIPSTVTLTGRSKSFTALFNDLPWTTLAEKQLQPGTKLPVVLYMHGCTGISDEDEQYRSLLLSQGYGVFMPDSFQRPGRFACSQEGSLEHRVSMRLDEIDFALKKIRELSWVDQNRVILMGWSEGGNATDNWSRKGFSAHIIISSACTLVGGEPAAPDGIPVLAIVGEYDDYRPGKSCKVKRDDSGSKSIVIKAGHHIAVYPETQEAIKLFLRKCCS